MKRRTVPDFGGWGRQGKRPGKYNLKNCQHFSFAKHSTYGYSLESAFTLMLTHFKKLDSISDFEVLLQKPAPVSQSPELISGIVFPLPTWATEGRRKAFSSVVS